MVGIVLLIYHLSSAYETSLFIMIFFHYCFNFLISADPPIKYDIMSRLRPALLKPETLYSLLRHRMIEEIRRSQNDQFRKDHEEEKNDKGNTNGGGNKVLRLTKPYYVSTLSFKKYMLQNSGRKYGIRVRRGRKMHRLRVSQRYEDHQKLPMVASVMKNRFHGVKRNPENESGLSPLDINFERHRRSNNINGKIGIICFFFISVIISTLLFFIIFLYTLYYYIQKILFRHY